MASTTISNSSIKITGASSGEVHKPRDPGRLDPVEKEPNLDNRRLQFSLGEASDLAFEGSSVPLKDDYLLSKKYEYEDENKDLKYEVRGSFQFGMSPKSIGSQVQARVGDIDEMDWSEVKITHDLNKYRVILESDGLKLVFQHEEATWGGIQRQTEDISLIEPQYQKDLNFGSIENREKNYYSLGKLGAKDSSQAIEFIREQPVAQFGMNGVNPFSNSLPNSRHVGNLESDNSIESNSYATNYLRGKPSHKIPKSISPLKLTVSSSIDFRGGHENTKPGNEGERKFAIAASGNWYHQHNEISRGWVAEADVDVLANANQRTSSIQIDTFAEQKMKGHQETREQNAQMPWSREPKVFAAERFEGQLYKLESNIVSTPQTKSIPQVEFTKAHIVDLPKRKPTIGVHVHRNLEFSEIQIVSENFEITELLTKNQADLKFSLKKIGVENFSLSFSNDQGFSGKKYGLATGATEDGTVSPETTKASEVAYSTALVDGLDILI